MSIPYPNFDRTLSDDEETGRGEFAAIDRIRKKLEQRIAPPDPASGETWIGDDSAVVAGHEEPLLVTTDLTVAGVHADLSLMGLDDLGWRALVSALSDIAAMGGAPHVAVVAVAAPPGTDLDVIYEGIASAAETFECPVVGGDLSTSSQLVISVTVTGIVDGGRPVLRSGGHPGDTLFVTGPLGSSSAGLRLLRESGREGPWTPAQSALVRSYLRPRPRLAEGEAARASGPSAMIDVSDGLSSEVGHLADASGTGFDLSVVPTAPGATEADALYGGEDYELVIAAGDPEHLLHEFATRQLSAPVAIGELTADQGQRSLRGTRLAGKGFEHRFR